MGWRKVIDMRRYWNTFTDEIGHLILEVALTQAEGKDPERRADRQYVDTGLSPDQLYHMCLARLVDGWQENPAVEQWQPLAMWAADTRFQQGMFRFLLKVEEALGHLCVIHDDEGKPRVFVAKDVTSAYSIPTPLLADAEPVR